MSPLLIIALLAAFGCLMVVLSCMVMSGNISEIERRAEIEAAIWRAQQDAPDQTATE